ncbi:MAG: MFS transporter [Thermoplasmata archaeon]
MVQYKWIALSNTTLGQLMATINTSIIIVALPPIFRNIDLNPLSPVSFPYLLWSIISYMIVISSLLVTVGKLSDIFGRVRLYNLGFAIFTLGSILLFILPGHGVSAALELIIFRMVQAIGGSFLMANSLAIITDNFPEKERGFAVSINSLASVAGVSIGIVVGGIVSVIYWRYVFLISVPIGIFGTAWSYIMLKDNSKKKTESLDLPGNFFFVISLVLLLLGSTYGITPYRKSPMGWANPFVIAAFIGGMVAMIIFIFIEKHAKNPMFRLDFFKIRSFSIGNFTGFVSAMGMMGLMYMLTVLLQGVWLPLHGIPFYMTPFWAGVYMLPATVSMAIFGIVGGKLSGRRSIKILTTMGLLISSVSFVLLATLPYNFYYIYLALYLIIFGMGYGLFNSPNIANVMSSVPSENRGVAAGMLNTMRNVGYGASMAVFFSILIYGLSIYLPGNMQSSLSVAGAGGILSYLTSMPPTVALFSAFLGIDPIPSILSTIPANVVDKIPSSALRIITGSKWFSSVLAPALGNSFAMVFYIVAGITFASAVISLFRPSSKNHTALKEKSFQKKTAPYRR